MQKSFFIPPESINITNITNKQTNKMENQETMTDEQYQEMEDQLWEAGRVYALEDICSEIEWPEGMTEEDIEEFCNTYEVVDCTASVEDRTCEVAIEGDNGLRVTALGTLDEDDDICWEIISQELEK